MLSNNQRTKQLENVFMKHYAFNHMLAPKENIITFKKPIITNRIKSEKYV